MEFVMESMFASDYSVEVTRNFTSEYINYISTLYGTKCSRVKEKSENYTKERMKFNFESGRFTHGFYIVKCKEQIVWTFGVDDFCNWGVVCRLLKHNSSSSLFPVIGAIAMPFVCEYLKDDVVGICGTQNIDKRNLFERGIARRSRVAERMQEDPNNIFTLVSHTKYTKLDYDVFYRNTRQQVYLVNTKKIPPFERYSNQAAFKLL